MLARIMGSGSSSSSSGISSHQLLAPPSPLPSTHPTPHQHQIISTTQQKLSSAIFYGTASFLIIFLNKLILGSNKQGFYGFPSFSFLAVTQFMTTSACLWGCKKAGKVQITELNVDVLRIMSPLVLISLANVISGLGGTQKINLPMFTVLRRFSIFLTMVRMCAMQDFDVYVYTAIYTHSHTHSDTHTHTHKGPGRVRFWDRDKQLGEDQCLYDDFWGPCRSNVGFDL